MGRIRKHFRESLASRTAIEDRAVLIDLSPELRSDTAFFIIDETVRSNPTFNGLPNSVLASLVEILNKTQMDMNEKIVRYGDPGVAMYILVDGLGRYDYGFAWEPPDVAKPSSKNWFEQLTLGQSFGEEVIFGLAETYQYT